MKSHPRASTGTPKRRNTSAQHPKAQRTGKASQTSPTPSPKPKQVKSTGGTVKNKGGVDETFGVDVTTTMWDKYPLVEIVWIDAVATATIEWSDIEEILEAQLAPSRAVGYLIEQTPQRSVVVALVNEEDAAHAMLIPAGMIHTTNILRKPT